MRTTDLSELAAFDAVARHKSFKRAGEERGVTPSAISHAVSNLEARIGLRLRNRTTRSVSMTDAGAVLLARLSPAFGDIGAAMDSLNQFRDTPFGKTAPMAASRTSGSGSSRALNWKASLRMSFATASPVWRTTSASPR